MAKGWKGTRKVLAWALGNLLWQAVTSSPVLASLLAAWTVMVTVVGGFLVYPSDLPPWASFLVVLVSLVIALLLANLTARLIRSVWPANNSTTATITVPTGSPPPIRITPHGEPRGALILRYRNTLAAHRDLIRQYETEGRLYKDMKPALDELVDTHTRMLADFEDAGVDGLGKALALPIDPLSQERKSFVTRLNSMVDALDTLLKYEFANPRVANDGNSAEAHGVVIHPLDPQHPKQAGRPIVDQLQDALAFGLRLLDHLYDWGSGTAPRMPMTQSLDIDKWEKAVIELLRLYPLYRARFVELPVKSSLEQATFENEDHRRLRMRLAVLDSIIVALGGPTQ